jgi:glutathione S-transferase
MKLYYSPGACALASQIALREAGIKFDLVKVDLKNKTYDGGDYKKLNPKGYIPALEIEKGEILTEGAAILQWIGDQVPEKNLIPKAGTKERYKAIEWLNFISTEIHKGLGALFNSAINSNETTRNSVIEKLQLRFEFINNHLQKNAFLLGSNFSVADAYLFNVVRWAQPLKVDISKHTAILGLLEKVGTRPTARAAIEAEGLKG